MITAFIISLFKILETTSTNQWTPQLGTTYYPKLLELSPYAKTGDIFKSTDGLYFKAVHSGRIAPEGDMPKPGQLLNYTFSFLIHCCYLDLTNYSNSIHFLMGLLQDFKIG